MRPCCPQSLTYLLLSGPFPKNLPTSAGCANIILFRSNCTTHCSLEEHCHFLLWPLLRHCLHLACPFHPPGYVKPLTQCLTQAVPSIYFFPLFPALKYYDPKTLLRGCYNRKQLSSLHLLLQYFIHENLQHFSATALYVPVPLFFQ